MRSRPEVHEYAPYYSPYLKLVPNGDIIDILSKQLEGIHELLSGISEEQALFKYGPDKWTIKEVLGHLMDTERIMAYRLLCIARGDQTSLPGYNEENYVQNAHFNQHSLRDLLGDLSVVRKSTIRLLDVLETDDWLKAGTANHYPVTVRAIAYIIAGHEKHHLNILKERYLDSEQFPSK